MIKGWCDSGKAIDRVPARMIACESCGLKIEISRKHWMPPSRASAGLRGGIWTNGNFFLLKTIVRLLWTGHFGRLEPFDLRGLVNFQQQEERNFDQWRNHSETSSPEFAGSEEIGRQKAPKA
jgi:hypothetical protein